MKPPIMIAYSLLQQTKPFMLTRAEKAAASKSSEIAQEKGSEGNYQPNECIKQPSSDNAAADDTKILRIHSEENLLSATSDQVKLCMKLAWNLIFHTVLSQQVLVEEEHAKYFNVVKEEDSKQHHFMKQLACERQVMKIENSDVSIYYELMSLGVENGAAMWRKLLGSGAPLIEDVEKVIITNDSGKETFETIIGRGRVDSLDSFLKLQLPLVDGTHSLNKILSKIEALQTRYTDAAVTAFHHAIACSGLEDKFGTMKCIQIKTVHDLNVKKLEERRQLIHHKLQLLDGKNGGSDCGEQVESETDCKSVVSDCEEQKKSGAKSYEAFCDMVRAMSQSAVGN